MSSFVVSDKTIANCVAAAAQVAADLWGSATDLQVMRRMLSSRGGGTTALGNALLRMNVRAVSRRYDESASVKRRPQRPLPSTCPYQLHKSLHCLAYQCSEGDIPGTKLYQELNELIHLHAGMIVRDDPRYDAAEWDYWEE